MRRRLAVVAPRVADAVRYTGGWLYDQVAAGWEVVVLVPGNADIRPLEILGATTVDLESALECSPHGPMPDTVAVATDLYEADARIRQGLLETLAKHPTTITMWGEGVPSELDSRFGSTQHRLSRAARVFKAHALQAATNAPVDVGFTESFRTDGIGSMSATGTLTSIR
ncbi:hypothetical protein HF877_15190 [Rhodococcus sp. BL-253-APC-6A1W]|nr:hypothetical protein [Rhodococcus sp. BL-253-APC-6A1W]NMD96723.1 hypothetical protein [Rhodococcus sp. BL-253-APC-6A1W]